MQQNLQTCAWKNFRNVQICPHLASSRQIPDVLVWAGMADLYFEGKPLKVVAGGGGGWRGHPQSGLGCVIGAQSVDDSQMWKFSRALSQVGPDRNPLMHIDM